MSAGDERGAAGEEPQRRPFDRRWWVINAGVAAVVVVVWRLVEAFF